MNTVKLLPSRGAGIVLSSKAHKNSDASLFTIRIKTTYNLAQLTFEVSITHCLLLYGYNGMRALIGC